MIKVSGLALLLVLLATSCGLNRSDPYEPVLVTVSFISGYKLTPSVVKPGDNVLVDFTIDTKTIDIAGIGATDAGIPSSLNASGGEIVTLARGLYTPGGPLPSYEVAKDYFVSVLDNNYEEQFGYQGGHFYALFRAPDSPQDVTINFNDGAASGHTDIPEKHISIPLNVQP